MARAQAQPKNEDRTSRRNGSGARRRKTRTKSRTKTRMSKRSDGRSTMQRAISGDVAAMRAEVDDLIASLEQRIGRINELTKNGASHAADGVNDLVVSAISGLTSGVAGRAVDNARSVSDEVAKFGTHTLRRVVRQIDKRPLLTVAIAAGIGFAFAMARRAADRTE